MSEEVDDEVLKFEREQKVEMEKQKRESALLKATKPIYNSLYGSVTPEIINEISRKQRKTMKKGDHVSLAYSEVPYDSVFKVIGQLHRLGLDEESEGTFVDLGSGVGNVIYGALLAHDFNVVVGIEILSDLHDIACEVRELWDSEVRKPLPLRKQETVVKLVRGDCCHIDWSYGDVVFANSTCFDNATMGNLARLACDMKPLAFLVCISTKLPSNIVGSYMDLVQTISLETSWGMASSYIYRRNQKPGATAISDRDAFVQDLIYFKEVDTERIDFR